MIYKCLLCNVPTKYKLPKNVASEDVFVLCDECFNNNATYTKSFCLDHLLLNRLEIDNLKYFYKNNSKLYLEDDIKKLIYSNYGDGYEKYKEQKLIKKNNLSARAQSKREERREQLYQKLIDNKLKYKTHGDCYTYVMYGYPDLDTVIENELEKCKKMCLMLEM